MIRIGVSVTSERGDGISSRIDVRENPPGSGTARCDWGLGTQLEDFNKKLGEPQPNMSAYCGDDKVRELLSIRVDDKLSHPKTGTVNCCCFHVMPLIIRSTA